MDPLFLLTLFVLGLFGGLLSGLLGIGGGIIMFPLLLKVPPLLGFAAFGVKTAAAVTSVQSFFGALSGAMGHHRHGRVSGVLVMYFGGSMAVTALLGSWLSVRMPDLLIVVLFAAMAVSAALLMMLRRPPEHDHDEVQAGNITFSRPRALGWGALLGVLSGIVGQGGGFLFVPVMLYVLHVPTRVAIGSALLVGILSSLSVMAGRIGTFQVPWLASSVVVAGAIVGAQLGSRFSQKVPRRLLRLLLFIVIVLTAVKMIVDLWY